MSEKEGIAGFKKSDFVGATPEAVFGSDVRLEELPDGIRLYIKEKAIDLGVREMIVNVYRLVDEGGLKRRRKWAAKFENRIPREDEVAERCGGGFYIWIAKFHSKVDGQERGIMSEEFEIDEALGAAAHEAWKRRQLVSSPASEVSSAAPAPARHQPAAGAPLDAMGLLAIMDAAEEKTLARMERMASMFKSTQTPADILSEAYKSSSEMMQKSVEMNMQVIRKVSNAQVKQIEDAAAGDDDAGGGEGGDGGEVPLPPWLKMIWPHLEAGIEKLLGGGPMGAAIKSLVISSDQWKEIMNDNEKWGQFVAAAEMQFGSDRTGRALDILLNRPKDKEAKKPQKGKGK